MRFFLVFEKFRCCGVNDLADWSEENELFGGTPKNWATTSRPDFNPKPDRRVPESCCDSSSNQVKQLNSKQTFVTKWINTGWVFVLCYLHSSF